jgi:hypothetical protein
VQNFSTFKLDIAVVLYGIININVKHNSINDFMKVYSYVLFINDMFRL